MAPGPSPPETPRGHKSKGLQEEPQGQNTQSIPNVPEWTGKVRASTPRPRAETPTSRIPLPASSQQGKIQVVDSQYGPGSTEPMTTSEGPEPLPDSDSREEEEDDEEMSFHGPSTAREVNEGRQLHRDLNNGGDPSRSRDASRNPEVLEDFDWEDLQQRWNNAMNEANETEKAYLKKFEDLVNYFNVWAQASSEQDNQRAQKRLRTREYFVQRAEISLEEKKKHHATIVKAFQDTMAMFNTT